MALPRCRAACAAPSSSPPPPPAALLEGLRDEAAQYSCTQCTRCAWRSSRRAASSRLSAARSRASRRPARDRRPTRPPRLPGTKFDVAVDSFGAEWLRTGPARQAIHHRHGNRGGGAGRPTARRAKGWLGLEMDGSVRILFAFEF